MIDAFERRSVDENDDENDDDDDDGFFNLRIYYYKIENFK